MTIGLLTARMLVRESRSLKEKRRVARSILDRLTSRFNVSAAEVDHLDSHQHLSLAVCSVGPDHSLVRQQLQTIQEMLRAHPVAVMLETDIQTGHEIV